MPSTAVNSRGATYYLHAKHVVLTNGRPQTQFYFARTVCRVRLQKQAA